jgi:hypothetical protein
MSEPSGESAGKVNCELSLPKVASEMDGDSVTSLDRA